MLQLISHGNGDLTLSTEEGSDCRLTDQSDFLLTGRRKCFIKNGDCLTVEADGVILFAGFFAEICVLELFTTTLAAK
jgi:hypothetical protein